MLRRLLLLLAMAAPAAAQPAPPPAATVVEAWQRGWREATAGVTSVEMHEVAEREIAGPRGTLRLATESDVRYAPGQRAVRTVRRATLDGAVVPPERLEALEARQARALGPGGGARLPPSPDVVFARAVPQGVRPEVLGGAPAWRVDMVLREPPGGRPPPDRPRRGRPPPPPGRLTAWFTPSASAPRLLRLAMPLGPEPRDAVTVDYTRVLGLDLPAAVRATATVRQQRRLRGYAVTTTARAAYGNHRITRR